MKKIGFLKNSYISAVTVCLLLLCFPNLSYSSQKDWWGILSWNGEQFGPYKNLENCKDKMKYVFVSEENKDTNGVPLVGSDNKTIIGFERSISFKCVSTCGPSLKTCKTIMRFFVFEKNRKLVLPDVINPD